MTVPTPSDDELLVQWVNAVDTMPQVEVPVTLTVGGILISGLMVNAASYMDAVVEQIAGVYRTPDVRADFVSQVGDYVASDGTMQPKNGARYIHLRNVVFLAPGASASQWLRAAWWRGRLSSVDGFSFGLATPADSGDS